MNTVRTWQTESSSSNATYELGERLGSVCRGGEVFLIVSDLGGGKTTFTKGLAKGLGSSENVTSPTYTISRVYKCRDGLFLHHFDFYRLQEGGMVAHDLSEIINEPEAVVAIEWGDVVRNVVPDKAVVVTINRTADHDDHRLISFSYPPESAYIMDGVK